MEIFEYIWELPHNKDFTNIELPPALAGGIK
jgi:hypothetical protein